MKIFLSPSNQVENKYSGVNTNECEVCYDIASQVYSILKQFDIDCTLADKHMRVADRMAIANKMQSSNDLYICIHTNAGGGEGTEAYASSKTIAAKNLFLTNIYGAVANMSIGKDRGIKNGDKLAEVKGTKATCVYIECEFHDTHGEWIYLNRFEIGNAIADALLKTLGVGTIIESQQHPIPKNDKLYRVQVGAYANKSNADAMLKKLTNEGYDAIIKES